MAVVEGNLNLVLEGALKIVEDWVGLVGRVAYAVSAVRVVMVDSTVAVAVVVVAYDGYHDHKDHTHYILHIRHASHILHVLNHALSSTPCTLHAHPSNVDRGSELNADQPRNRDNFAGTSDEVRDESEAVAESIVEQKSVVKRDYYSKLVPVAVSINLFVAKYP